ncbi:hypothetical protein MTHERMOG20_22060 [Moorella thermoacetica]|uniref:hypothetical protein n=1 Tax=Neomoorella thermoacetica TaxID=1525 RepID=UPI000039B032|nr:hypothetical protein [Moorella thermoacetica]AKX93093.1 hypothetical protein MOTHE_c02760 [Moorella thermoacetica]AKX95643.1 hypothetical protein MOTHA_c02730 [Moorella thermoacetica]OIQ53475.1 hypothetical protein MOCA_25160 [Moorella thermoacetica]QCZ99452.1 hypothetical protein MothHH_00281 [Moorella thermoacetica]TYL07682.1 hypothetical protein MOOCA_20280 [Moorella thermoacetica]
MRRTTTFPARGHNAMASWQKVTPFLAGGLELCLGLPFTPPALFTPEELDPERPGKNGGNAVAAAGKTAGENE